MPSRSAASSAKTGDVDHVWELTAVGDPDVGVESIVTQVQMRRTHTRTGLGSDSLLIIRTAVKTPEGSWATGGTRHELANPSEFKQENQEVQACVDSLLKADAPGGMGRDALKAWAAMNGVALPGKTRMLAEIVKALKKVHSGN